MKGIYEFFWDCGRQGKIEGLFIADDTCVENVIGKTISFGAALGKHSEVDGKIEDGDITLKTNNQDFIRQFTFIFGEGTISGYNPLDHYEPESEE